MLRYSEASGFPCAERARSFGVPHDDDSKASLPCHFAQLSARRIHVIAARPPEVRHDAALPEDFRERPRTLLAGPSIAHAAHARPDPVVRDQVDARAKT